MASEDCPCPRSTPNDEASEPDRPAGGVDATVLRGQTDGCAVVAWHGQNIDCAHDKCEEQHKGKEPSSYAIA